jgi:hypothetical protein
MSLYLQAKEYSFWKRFFYVNNFQVAIFFMRIQYEHNFFFMRRLSSIIALIALSAQLIPAATHAE